MSFGKDIVTANSVTEWKHMRDDVCDRNFILQNIRQELTHVFTCIASSNSYGEILLISELDRQLINVFCVVACNGNYSTRTERLELQDPTLMDFQLLRSQHPHRGPQLTPLRLLQFLFGPDSL